MKNGDAPDEAHGKGHPTVVGIGASAGGLGALKRLFAQVQADSEFAWVIVVHLSPEHESHLAELLQPHVPMPVQQVSSTVPLEPGRVYVIPPNANLNAIDTHLRLSPLEVKRQERAPVDHFFRTLARTHDGNAIGVILSGTGSDGTLGLRDITEKGGLAIVQDPNEAEYDGMPQSAISTGLVDLVLPLTEIPAAILRYTRTRPRVPVPRAERDLEEGDRQLLQKIFAQLRARTGRDFTSYKKSTILRRIARRMQLVQIEEFHDYLELLRREVSEVEALADDLLITVTSFFRDPEVYKALVKEVIPKLYEDKHRGEDLRVWSVGCATGEEAYSVAMLLLEEAGRREQAPRIQIFASDLHERSLQRAREGLYPGDIETDVTPERLKRFFVRENGGYRIRKEVRELVVFAPHNLLGDPPFSRMDLITCRNVLIYLERDVQPHVFSLFHYALNANGWLVLGTSERVDTAELFRVEDKQHCVYRKRNVPAPELRLPVFPLTRGRLGGSHQGVNIEPNPAPHAYGELHERMVERYAPPSVLVSPDDRVVHLSENAGRYLVHPGGEVTSSIFKLVREELRIDLRTALHAARESRQPQRTHPQRVQFNGEHGAVAMHVLPSRDDNEAGFALVIFEELPASEASDTVAGAGVGPKVPESAHVRDLESERDLARQRFQAILEEFETSREEMKASNEELQSTNEELRSTMEELETSKEELQSMNEELQTVNQENRHKVAELAQLSSDLHNLLAATDIATLFLDRDLRIMRFTPKVGELFNVRTTDRGRPLSDLTHRLAEGAILDDALNVLATLIPAEREVLDDEGRWYLTRTLPYRSAEDRIDGVVMTFVDITSRKRAEADVLEAKKYSESIVETLHEPLLVLNPDLRVKSANAAFFEGFGVTREETVGKLVYDLGNRQWNIPALRELLEDVLPANNVFRDFEVDHTFENIGRRVMLLNARRLDDVQLILLGIRDITTRKESDEALRASEARLRALVNATSYIVYRMSPDWSEMRRLDGRGFMADTTAPSSSWMEEYIHPDDRTEVQAAIQDAIRRKSTFEMEHRVRRLDGTLGWTLSRAVPLLDEHGEITEWFGAASDVTERREAVEALRDSEARFRAVAELVPDLLWRSEPDGRAAWFNHRWMEYTGQTLEQAQGWGWVDAIHAEDRERSRANYASAVEQGEPLEQEQRIRAADGSYRWFLVRAEPIRGPDGAVLHYFGSATDVHEQRSALANLEQLVHERTRQVRELASRITLAEQEERHRVSQILHDDLQQLLYGIQMKLELALRLAEQGAADALLAQTRESLGVLDQAIERTRRLSVDLSPPVLEGEGLVEAIQWLRTQMRELHGLDVKVEVEDGRNIRSRAHRVLLFQAVRELLFNVAKHAGTNIAHVRVDSEDGRLRVTVSDSGTGFDPHARPPAADRTDGGLGLFNLRERLRLHGGDVAIESAPGHGTQIRLYLPVEPSPLSESRSASET